MGAAVVLQRLVGLIFLITGFSKVAGSKMQIDAFSHLGLPQWFRMVTGIVQLIGVILLILGIWYPALAAIGGLWLFVTMFFGVVAHMRVKDPAKDSVPAAVLMVLSLIVFILNRSDLMALMG